MTPPGTHARCVSLPVWSAMNILRSEVDRYLRYSSSALRLSRPSARRRCEIRNEESDENPRVRAHAISEGGACIVSLRIGK